MMTDLYKAEAWDRYLSERATASDALTDVSARVKITDGMRYEHIAATTVVTGHFLRDTRKAMAYVHQVLDHDIDALIASDFPGWVRDGEPVYRYRTRYKRQ